MALAVLLTGCNQTWNFENNTGATKQGHYIFRMFQGFDIASLFVGALVWGLIFWCILRYRRKSADQMPKQTRYNIPWEILYTTTPVFVVAGLFAITIVGENYVNKVVKHPDQVLTVTGFQWGWKFDYTLPDGRHAVVVTDPGHYGTVELPLNKTTQINLLSADVVHNFFVPAFNYNRYAQPGVTNVWDVTPTKAGRFVGRCNFICGLHHALMIFYVKNVPDSEFQNWLQQHAKAGA